MAAIPEDLVERCEGIDAILVEAASGYMGVGQVQDPMGHSALRSDPRAPRRSMPLHVTPRW
jgi:hypothetical protein